MTSCEGSWHLRWFLVYFVFDVSIESEAGVFNRPG